MLEKGEWIQCLNLDQNSTELDVRFNTPSDIQKIRCPFEINANPREAKAYMIRAETNYKSEIAAAIPMLAPPDEVLAVREYILTWLPSYYIALVIIHSTIYFFFYRLNIHSLVFI